MSTVLKAIVSPFASSVPGKPTEPPTVWALLAFVRREFDGNVSKVLLTANSVPNPIATGLLTDTPSINTIVAGLSKSVSTVDAQPSAVAATSTQSPLYTGQPSSVEKATVAVLRVINAVLNVVGIRSITELAAIQVPIFDDGIPPFFVTAGLNVGVSEFEGMPVWTLQEPGSTSDKVIVGLHGGAYVGQVSIFHWWMYSDIARDTGATVVVPIYPVAPVGTAATVVPEMADLLTQLIDQHGSQNVSVLGDSAGGGLALAAVQLLVSRGAPTPGRMVLLSPWLDATVSDPASQTIPDPVLDVTTLREDGLLWAGNLNPANPLVSPINGSLSGLPPTWVYSGSLDLLSPETLRLRQLALAQGDTNFTFILANGEIHDWVTFPFLPDAVADYPAIESELLGTNAQPPSNSSQVANSSQV